MFSFYSSPKSVLPPRVLLKVLYVCTITAKQREAPSRASTHRGRGTGPSRGHAQGGAKVLERAGSRPAPSLGSSTSRGSDCMCGICLPVPSHAGLRPPTGALPRTAHYPPHASTTDCLLGPLFMLQRALVVLRLKARICQTPAFRTGHS